MKRLITFLIVLSVIFVNSNAKSYADDELNLSAEAAILIDSKTGDILYEKNISKKMFPASTTKVLTAILAIENSDLSDEVKIDPEVSSSAEGSHIALEPGEILTMDDLLHALLLESANDSAMAIAKHVSGSVKEFSDLMNKKAVEIGAKNSSFTNPSGLPDDNHTTTAYDLAMIANYAMKNDVFREIVKKTTYTIEPTNKKSEARVLNNTNKMLFSDQKIDVNGVSTTIKYKNVTGIKTGYTKAAEQCLVSGVNDSGKEYISVVFHSIGTDVYVDTHKLLGTVTKYSQSIVLAKKNEFIDNIFIKGGDSSFITAVLSSDFSASPNGEEISREFIPNSKLSLPISKGQVVGKLNFKDGDISLGSADVISDSQILKSGFSLNSILSSLIYKWWFWLLTSIIVLRVTVGIKRTMYRIKKLKMKKTRKKRQTAS